MRYALELKGEDEALFNAIRDALPFRVTTIGLIKLALRGFALHVQDELELDPDTLVEVVSAIRIIKGAAHGRESKDVVSGEDVVSSVQNDDEVASRLFESTPQDEWDDHSTAAGHGALS